ncbi:hypothetical protein ACJX0J_036407 [Zea mays]
MYMLVNIYMLVLVNKDEWDALAKRPNSLVGQIINGVKLMHPYSLIQTNILGERTSEESRYSTLDLYGFILSHMLLLIVWIHPIFSIFYWQHTTAMVGKRIKVSFSIYMFLLGWLDS